MIKKMKITYSGIILWFALTGVSAGQNNACFLMTPGDAPCHLTINDSDYHISSNGVIVLKIIKQKKSEVKIVLPEDFYIEAVQYQVINKNIMFTFEMTDGESGSTLIAMFDPSNPVLKWSTEIHAFNPSPLLILQDYIYVGGIGMVAKLNLIDGKIIWQHKNLYERETQAFNSFILPRKEGNIIIFKEDKVSSAKYDGIREIHVDDTTGEIISK